MPLNFPSSPSLNEIYSSGGNSWIWSGTAWKTYNSSFSSSLSINGDIIFEGSTVDSFETTLTVADPTADRTVTIPDSSGSIALTNNKLNDFAATSSSELAGIISDETGSGALVFANTPTLVTPILGTPQSGNLSNCTSLSLSTGVSGTLPIANGGTGTSTGNITGSGALTFTAGGVDTNVNLVPNGTGTVDVASKRITNVYDPSGDNDAANKKYVDDVAQGLHIHSVVKSATTAKLATLSGASVSYSPGTKAITWTGGTALTSTFNDGMSFTVSTTESSADRLLVKNEGDSSGLGAAYNGTYYCYGARELRRTSDADTAAEYAGGDFCFVSSGTVYAGTGWVQTQTISTLDSDSIFWDQFSGAGTYTADGVTLTKTGNQFSINTGYLGQSSITTLGTISTGTWNGAVVLSSYGGTGLSSYTAGDIVYYATGTSFSKLAIGNSNYVLTSSGSAPQWTKNTGTGNVVMATSPTFSTSVVGGSSIDVFNTTSTTVNAFGAATLLTIGATSGTAALRNSTLRLGNTVSTLTTNIGTSNSLTVNPYGSVVLSPTSSLASGGDRASITITNDDLAAGQVQIEGGDLYLGNKFDDSTTTPVNIIFEGASVNSFQTTLSIVEPTADRDILLPNVSGTLAVISSSDTQVMFNDGGVIGGDAGMVYSKSTDTLSVVKIGVNTSSPGRQVEINSSTGECLRLTYDDSDGSASNYADMSVSSSGDLTITTSGSDLILPTTSRLGINKTDPGYALDVNSSSGANLRLIYDSSSGTPANYALFVLSSSGDLTITPSGADVNMNANMDMSDYTLSRVELRDYCERSSSPAINAKTLTLTLDLSTSQVFTVSLDNNISTVAVTSIPDNGNANAVSFIVIFTADGTARSITWPVNFNWRNDKVPVLTSVNGEKEVIKFITTDAGTTWTAFRLTETPQEDMISCYINSDPDLITTGIKAFRPVPYDCEIVAWYIVSDASGTIAFDINSSSFASYPTTSSIVTTLNYPSLAAASKDSDESVSGWTQLSAGDMLEFEITSNTDVANVGVYLKIRRIQ